MFPIKAIPVTTPGIDLALFKDILPAEHINDIDALRNLHPLSKFAEAMEESISTEIDPYRHIYQAFYFELPGAPYIEMVNMELLSITATTEGLIVKGYISASLSNWVKFLEEASVIEQSQYLRFFSNLIFNCLRNLPPFKNLDFKSHKDKTFSLVKRKEP